MSDPDTNSSNTDILTISFPVALFFLLVIVLLFQLKDSIPMFNLILWGVIPITVLFVVSGVNMIMQYTSCRKINAGKAILGSLASGATVLIGLGISSIAYCRIPIASVVVPLVIKKVVDITKNKSNTTINSLKNTNSKECCVPKITLEAIESTYPFITGISYGFYTMFSILFGMIVGNGISTIC